MGTVVVVGSLNVDLVTRVARHPRPGETVTGEGLERRPGGKGANQALAAARAGATVRLVGRVGDDAAGAAYLDGLAARGVDVTGVRRTAGLTTGHALIAVDAAGENSIVVVPGANAAVTAADVAAARPALAAAAVVLLQLELPAATVRAAAELARDAGARVVLNPSPVAALEPDLLAAVDVVVANEHEAADLGSYAGTLVTTLGARGAVWHGATGRGEAAAPRVAAVDTTGAGDAFTGALAAALASGLPEPDVLELAVAAGARAVTWAGAQEWTLAP